MTRDRLRFCYSRRRASPASGESCDFRPPHRLRAPHAGLPPADAARHPLHPAYALVPSRPIIGFNMVYEMLRIAYESLASSCWWPERRYPMQNENIVVELTEDEIEAVAGGTHERATGVAG